MKKIALATLLAVSAISASAVEVGIVGGSDYYINHGGNRGTAGVTVGEHFGAFSLTAEADREIKKNTDKYSVIGGYDITKFGTATLTAKAGATYIDNSTITSNGNHYAGLFGAGVTVPVTSNVGLTVDYRYQYSGNSQAKTFNGNTVLVGAKYAF